VNSKSLVSAALGGFPVPRVPVGPLAVHFCAGLAGHTVHRYSTDPDALAESVIRYYERFKPDVVWVSADTWVSAEAMGAKVGATDEQQPLGGLGEPLIRSAADIDRIPSPDVSSQGRYPLMLKALSRIVNTLGKDAYVVGCFDQYPFSLAAALMGINEIMVKVLDDPSFVQALMNRCSEYAFAYACALGSAGADLLSGGDSPAGLLAPSLYREVVLPAEQRLIQKIKDTAAKPVSLHICGNATRILAMMGSSGAGVLELDSNVDLAQACQTLGPDIAIWGNLNPVQVLAQGTPAQVTAAAQEAIAQAASCEHSRFVLSSGCTLPMETPHANIDALVLAARVTGAFARM